MTLTGKWTGKLMDIKGFVGDLELALEHSGERLEGRIAVRIMDEESQERFTVPLTGTVAGQEVTLTYKESPQAPLNFVFQGRVADAMPHARYAIYGTYKLEGESERSYLGGGCCLFWLYRK